MCPSSCGSRCRAGSAAATSRPARRAGASGSGCSGVPAPTSLPHPDPARQSHREAMLASGSVPVNGVVLTLLVLVTSIALVAGLAWASRRLLGLPVGALRALIAGLLGFAAAYFLGRALQAAQPGHLAAFITVGLGVPLVVAMILLVVAEALVPSGMVPQPLEVIRGTPAGGCALTAL